MGVVKKNELASFLRKLNLAETNAPQLGAEIVANRGTEIAREEYTGTHIDVKEPIVNVDGTAKIIATGKGISYMEFGTGLVGKGKYQGNLPQSGVPITGNWEYYYDSPAKTEKDGKKGWYYGKTFTEGQEPKQQMFKTSQRLKEEFRKNYKGD